MTTDYTKLDAAIIAAIDNRKSPLYDGGVSREASPIAAEKSAEKSAEMFRVIDRRLQAMRKAGRIVFDRPNARWRIA